MPKWKKNIGNGQHHNATALPTLQKELTRFKAICRHIVKHEASHVGGKLFKAEHRQKLTRLAELGVRAHQPAIAAYCKVTAQERTTIINAILTQKAGTTPKL